MLLLGIITLALMIPLAYQYPSTIFSTGRFTLLISLLSYFVFYSEIFGGLFQTTILPQDLETLFSIFVPLTIYLNANIDKPKILINELDLQFQTWLISNKSVKVYLNSAESKDLIYNGDCRIYQDLWYNINGEYYVGSSIKLKRWFSCNFSPAYLKKKKIKLLILRAIMYHIHGNFCLYLLKYCNIEN